MCQKKNNKAYLQFIIDFGKSRNKTFTYISRYAREVWDVNTSNIFELVQDDLSNKLRGGQNSKEDFNIRVGKRIDQENKEYFYGV